MTSLDPPRAATPGVRAVRLAVVVLVPAAVAVLLTLHPAGNGVALLGQGGRYYWLHIVLLFGFPATAVSLWVLLHGQRTAEAWAARVAAFVYACLYGAYDALAGITIGAYTMRADETAATLEEAEAILAMRGPLSATGIIGRFAGVGRIAFGVACALAAVALHRAGVRWWVLVPLLASGYLLLANDHVPPLGWSAFAALAVAGLLVELVPRRRISRRAEP
ncbi:hypothetical protein FTX61_11195 [Nitriliruptoraceae bacterium ZYF776]|nr:hypothetical protein [Profundirhabdus halotolerans]